MVKPSEYFYAPAGQQGALSRITAKGGVIVILLNPGNQTFHSKPYSQNHYYYELEIVYKKTKTEAIANFQLLSNHKIPANLN